jgi:ribose/xylose/arabinose/galactoside ABC-type transport system permease subunit
MIDSVNMTDRTSSLLSGGAEIMGHRVSGSRLMCAGLIVTLIGVALALMATYEIPRHWTTAVVGAALLLAGGLRYMLASRDATDGDPRPR